MTLLAMLAAMHFSGVPNCIPGWWLIFFYSVKRMFEQEPVIQLYYIMSNITTKNDLLHGFAKFWA